MDWQVEVIYWEDPHSVDPWTDVEELKTSIAQIISVGFVVKETKDSIALSLSWDKIENTVSCVMIIPKYAITKRRKLNVDNRKKKRR